MKNFKRIFLVGAFSLAMIPFATQTHAAARSNVGMDYLFRNPTLGRLTAGVYAGRIEREISQNGLDNKMTSTRGYGYLGIDAARWVNIYGVLGMNEAELDNTPKADSEILFGIGASFNLLNHFVREPTPMEDAIRINADMRLISTKTDFPFPQDSVTWQEFTTAIRISLVNFPTGDKRYRPEAIALYGGPIFSYIQSSDIEAKQEFGATGGLEIFFYDSLSFDVNMEYYDSLSVFGGLNFRF